MRPTIFLLVLCLFASIAHAANKAPPNDFAKTFAGLAAIVDLDAPTPMDVAKGSFLAAKYFSVGQPGLPFTTSRFKHAQTRGEASMAGLYMAIHGSTGDIHRIRRDLETSPTKRSWLREMVGSEALFKSSLEQGAQWAPLVRVLPSTAGCKAFSTACIQSPDPLVRRAGIYWGYWIPSDTYWQKVSLLAKSDPEPVTRRIAAMVAAKAPAAKKTATP